MPTACWLNETGRRGCEVLYGWWQRNENGEEIFSIYVISPSVVVLWGTTVT
jgi:hypothetical protein